MPSPNTREQEQLVAQARTRFNDSFNQIIGEGLHEKKFEVFATELCILLEEYATMRRVQGADGIRWGRDTMNYLSVKLARLKAAEEKKP